VEDLGTRWETETGCPLPLGGIVASRRLPADTIATVQRVIHDSLQHALADRAAALPTMRAHAQEHDDNVLMQHVDLYVNEWTVNLGAVGSTGPRRTLGPSRIDRPGNGPAARDLRGLTSQEAQPVSDPASHETEQGAARALRAGVAGRAKPGWRSESSIE
jgi:hypothetical protein